MSILNQGRLSDEQLFAEIATYADMATMGFEAGRRIATAASHEMLRACIAELRRMNRTQCECALLDTLATRWQQSLEAEESPNTLLCEC